MSKTWIYLYHLSACQKIITRKVLFADKDYFSTKADISGKYVTVENCGEDFLTADREAAAEWENFKVVNNDDETFSIQARANNKYLFTIFDEDNNKESPIIARSSKVQDWEKFTLILHDEGSYSIKTFNEGYYVQADVEDTSRPGVLHALSDTIGTWERFSLESDDSSALPQPKEGEK